MEANTSKSKTLSVGPRRTSRTSTQQTLLVPLSSQMISKSMENLISEEETSRKSTKTVSISSGVVKLNGTFSFVTVDSVCMQ